MKRSFYRSKLRFLLILLLGILVLEARADSVLVAQTEVPDLMQSAERLGKLFNHMTPGAAGRVGAGVIALSFMPQFESLDFTTPIRIYLYAVKENDKMRVAWAGAVDKKEDKVPDKIKVMGTVFFTKVIGETVFLSDSKVLTDEIKAVPEQLKTKGDVLLSLHPNHLLATDPVQGERLVAMFADFFAPIDEDDAEKQAKKSKERNVRLKVIRSLLTQVEDLDLTVNFMEDQADLRMKLAAMEQATLDGFFQAQQARKLDLPELAADADCTWTADLVLTKGCYREVTHAVQEIAAADLGAGGQAMELATVLVPVKNARLWGWSKPMEPSVSSLRVEDIGAAQKKLVDTLLPKLDSTAVESGLYRLDSGDVSSNSSYLDPGKTGLGIIWGGLSPKELRGMADGFAGKRVSVPNEKRAPVVGRFGPGDEASWLRLRFARNTAVLDVELKPWFLKQVIPAFLLAPTQRQKIRLR